MAERGSLGLLTSSFAVVSLACAPLLENNIVPNGGFVNKSDCSDSSSVVENADVTPPIPPIVKPDGLAKIIATSTVSNYDKNDLSVDQAILKDVLKVVQRVSVNFSKRVPYYEMANNTGPLISTNTGSAIILTGCDGARYALTANHVIPFNEDICEDWRSAYSLTVGAARGKVVYRDCELDLALIKLTGSSDLSSADSFSDSVLPYYNHSLGKEIRPGDYVLGAGHGFAGPKAFFDGKVRAVPDAEHLWFHFNGSAVSGDSGSPLFALEGRQLWLVGITAYKILDKNDSVGTGGAAGVNSIAKVLKSYLEDGQRPLEHYVIGVCAR